MLTGCDRNIECGGHFGKTVRVVMLDGLLEPHIAQFLEHPPDTNSALDRVPIVGIEGQWKTLTHELAHGAGLGNISSEVGITGGFVCIEADFHLGWFQAHPCLDDATHLVHTPHAVVANRGIKRERRTPGTAQQLVDGLTEQLAFEVPQGNIDRGQCPGIGPLWADFDVLMEQAILQDTLRQRVSTDKHGCERTGDDFQ